MTTTVVHIRSEAAREARREGRYVRIDSPERDADHPPLPNPPPPLVLRSGLVEVREGGWPAPLPRTDRLLPTLRVPARRLSMRRPPGRSRPPFRLPREKWTCERCHAA